MGKRIGTARIEGLLENLKREIELSGTTLKGAAVQGHKRTVEVIDDPRIITLTTEDAGKIIVLTRGQSQAVNLPNAASGGDDRIGMEVDIIAGSAHNHIVHVTDDDTLSMISISPDGTERDHAFSEAQLSDGAIGDRFNCYYDGNFWIVTAYAKSAVNNID